MKEGDDFVGPYQQGQGTCKSTCLLGDTRQKWRCYDFAREVVILVWILDRNFRDKADNGVNYEVRDGTFDAWDVKEVGKKQSKVMKTPRQTANSYWRKDVKICYHCGKPDHIACLYYKIKSMGKHDANNTNENDEYVIAIQHWVYSCKWIMDSWEIKHITSNKVVFDTYKRISPLNVNLSDNDIVGAMGIGSIVEVLVRGETKKFCTKYVLNVPKL